MTSSPYPTQSSSSVYRTTADRTTAQKAALAVGAVFLLVGIAGFVPGITQNLDDIEFAGHESGAELLGVFQVSVLHNLVHLAFGIAGLAAARRYAASRAYLIGGGVIYLALFVYGLLVDDDHDANFVPLNDADDWLHLGLGVGMIALGLLLRDEWVRTGRDPGNDRVVQP